jgi:hypothetical protein
MIKTKKKILEDAGAAGGFAGGTTIGSVGGAIEVPLMGISKRKFNKRIVPGNKKVEAPQGTFEEEIILKKDLKEWFKVQKTQASPKPSYDGGKFVEIKPKCETFPYCSQGSTDSPIKLIGESKEEMCPNCYAHICEIAYMTNKTPDYIAKTIRIGYLSKNNNK